MCSLRKKTRELYALCNGDFYFDMLVKKENAGNISNDDLQLDVLAEAVDSILLVGVGLHPLLQAA